MTSDCILEAPPPPGSRLLSQDGSFPQKCPGPASGPRYPTWISSGLYYWYAHCFQWQWFFFHQKHMYWESIQPLGQKGVMSLLTRNQEGKRQFLCTYYVWTLGSPLSCIIYTQCNPPNHVLRKVCPCFILINKETEVQRCYNSASRKDQVKYLKCSLRGTKMWQHFF